MGTRSRIAVLLKEDDRTLGKELKFNPNKIEHQYSRPDGEFKPKYNLKDIEFEPMVVPEKAEVVSMYCQFDGYLEGVGETLVRDYDTYDKALNLVLGGPAESISRHVLSDDGEYSGGYRNCLQDYPNSTRPKTVFSNIDNMPYEAFTYLFKDGEWYYDKDGGWSLVLNDILIPV